MFTGSLLAELLDVIGTPDAEGRVQYVITVAAVVRVRVAPLDTEERKNVRPVQDVSTVVVMGGTIPCNPKQWVRIHYGHGPITYRIKEVRWLSNAAQRLFCDQVTTANASREETFFELATEPVSQSEAELPDGQALTEQSQQA